MAFSSDLCTLGQQSMNLKSHFPIQSIADLYIVYLHTPLVTMILLYVCHEGRQRICDRGGFPQSCEEDI